MATLGGDRETPAMFEELQPAAGAIVVLIAAIVGAFFGGRGR